MKVTAFDHIVFNVRNVEVSVVKQGARGAIHSIYVRDPDGNLIEVASYA